MIGNRDTIRQELLAAQLRVAQHPDLPPSDRTRLGQALTHLLFTGQVPSLDALAEVVAALAVGRLPEAAIWDPQPGHRVVLGPDEQFGDHSYTDGVFIVTAINDTHVQLMRAEPSRYGLPHTVMVRREARTMTLARAFVVPEPEGLPPPVPEPLTSPN